MCGEDKGKILAILLIANIICLIANIYLVKYKFGTKLNKVATVFNGVAVILLLSRFCLCENKLEKFFEICYNICIRE